MICLAPLSYLFPDAALDVFEVRDTGKVRARHLHQSHPRPVAAEALVLRPAAH